VITNLFIAYQLSKREARYEFEIQVSSTATSIVMATESCAEMEHSGIVIR
jgi:uncharacterized membrane protein